LKKVIPLPFVVLAAIVAVGFWSLKPIFIAMVGDRTGYVEVFLISSSIASAASLLIALLMYQATSRLLRSKQFWSGLLQAMASGTFLAIWYYCFYRALFSTQKVDATIIAFSWPLIAVVAMRFIAPKHARNLRASEWVLISTAYIGAIAIGVSGISRVGLLEGWELLFAFIAALAGGLYLPFGVNAVHVFDSIIGNKIKATFFAISLANLTSLILLYALVVATGQPLLFYAIDVWVVLICVLIGIGTYLLAEITWTWAFTEYKSLTLSSLAYLSPAFSVILLFLFFDQNIAPISAFGLILILFSNMSLHGSYRSSNALISALTGTLYVALISLFIQPAEIPQLTDMLYFISGLFAILAGFILSRVSSRRAQEIDGRTQLVRTIVDHAHQNDLQSVERADRLLRGVIDVEFEPDLNNKAQLSGALREQMSQGEAAVAVRQSQLLAFDTWLNIHRDRLSIAEKAALWLTGGVSILLLLVVRGDDPLATVGLYAFAAGCLLAIFSINDYETNNFQGFQRQTIKIQDGFREIGKSYYLPRFLVENNEIPRALNGATLRYCDETGSVCSKSVVSARNTFRIVYLSTAGLVVGALLTLPLFLAGESRDSSIISLRPELFTDSAWPFGQDQQADVTVGVLDWAGSEVIAEVLRLALEEELNLTVELQESTVDDILEAMASDPPSIDIHSDFWIDNQPAAYQRFVERDGVVRLNARPYLGQQGIYLPADDANALGLSNLDQLVDADVAALFDDDGDGYGELWIGASGWRSTRAVEALLISYGLDRYWRFESFSETIFKAKLVQFHEQNRPLVFYAYEPDWIHAAFDLQALEISVIDGACPDILGIERVGSLCVFHQVPVHIGYRSDLARTLPFVADFISAASFSTEDVSAWLAALSTSDLSAAEVARAWIADNGAAVASWSRAARAAD
jgi:glycine betaine/proline transport system substrate-binding protein